MLDDNNLDSVEAALAQPQNQPVAPAPTRPVAPTPQAANLAGVANTQPPASPSALAPRYQNALGIMRQAALAARRGIGSGDVAAAKTASNAALARLVDSLRANPSQEAQPGPGASAPPQLPAAPGAIPVRMFSPAGGGRAVPSYERNGDTVLLGDDIDMNDGAAVQRRIAETNDLIDMMNNAYEED